MYFVFESQYELRQFGRLFVDMLTFKGWKQPITKADAASQKNYLKRLPKYRVMAVLAGSELEPQSKEGLYLKRVAFKPNARRDELPLQVEYTAHPEGEFRFDEENGWLFRDDVDEYDYMYHVHVGSPSIPPGAEKLSLSWERSRMTMEEEPYRFKGAFQVMQELPRKFLEWRYCSKGEQGCRKPRWDTKKLTSANIFITELQDQELRLCVTSLGLPLPAPTPAAAPVATPTIPTPTPTPTAAIPTPMIPAAVPTLATPTPTPMIPVAVPPMTSATAAAPAATLTTPTGNSGPNLNYRLELILMNTQTL